MMKKKEEAGECTGDALVLQHAKVVLLVCALGVTRVAFLTALARHVLTLQGMPKLDLKSNADDFLYPF